MKKDELLNKLYKLKRFEVGVGVLDFMSKTAVKLNHVLALVEQLDEPEKVVIPQFVADWWERDGDSVKLYGGLRVDKKCKLYIISNFHDKGLGDYLSKVEDWLYKNNSIFLDLVNGKPYEVEKEPLYYVKFIGGNEMTYLNQSNENPYIFISIKTSPFDNKTQFTEKEIKSINEHYWAFAVPVEEEE